jgi:hypothetical protein
LYPAIDTSAARPKPLFVGVGDGVLSLWQAR